MTPPAVEVIAMSKRFGALEALRQVSLRFAPGCFHAILGENGAGKSTLVKCMMGYHRPDAGQMRVDGQVQAIRSTRDAHRLGLGLVYQHFTLVANMTVAENLILGRADLPAVIDWPAERARIDKFMRLTPFRIDSEAPVRSLAAGEKQKLEILKQLYLDRTFLILDEPTSVLTPNEARQLLGLLGEMAEQGALSIVLITHKLREVVEFARQFSVLRTGCLVGNGTVGEVTKDDLTLMMFGRREAGPERATSPAAAGQRPYLEIERLDASNDAGVPAVRALSLSVAPGEILGIAGVSGNGQRELVEVLAGQRATDGGTIRVAGAPYGRTREEMRRHRVFLLTEEPLANACVRSMSLAENLGLRNFDVAPQTRLGCLIDRAALRRQARRLIERYAIKTQGPEARLETLSGGNVQRSVLARELSGRPALLIAQNPCFGLDQAAVGEIHQQLLAARRDGAAVLLISEDLDELLALADRVLVMLEGRIVYATRREAADVQAIGRHMTAHAEAAVP